MRILLVWAVALAGVGCAGLERDPAPNLPPSSVETMRKLIGVVDDARLKRELMDRLDIVQAQWPVRETNGVARPGDPGEPTPVESLRVKAAEVADAKLRGDMYVELDSLARQWKTGNMDSGRPVGWFLVPEKVRVDSFTSFKFTEAGQPYLEARVQVLDADEHPMRTIGKFRIEMYAFVRGTADPRGQRLAMWNIDIQDHDDNRKYFDSLINGYTFTLDLEQGGALNGGAKYVVEATFIRPDGRRVHPSNYRYVEAPTNEGDPTVVQPGPKKATNNRLRTKPAPLVNP